MIIAAVPYLLLVAVSARRLRLRAVRHAAVALIVVWATIAGVLAFGNRGNQRIAWASLAREIATAEATPNLTVRVYMPEAFVAAPLRFYFAGEDGGGRFQVIEVADPSEWQGERFWVALRPSTWRFGRSPEQILSDGGYKVERTLVSKAYAPGTVGDEVRIIAVRK